MERLAEKQTVAAVVSLVVGVFTWILPMYMALVPYLVTVFTISTVARFTIQKQQYQYYYKKYGKGVVVGVTAVTQTVCNLGVWYLVTWMIS